MLPAAEVRGRGLISMRLHGKRKGCSDRAHAGFYRAGYLLEDLAGLAPTENLRSDCFVLGHERHGQLVLTLAINPSGRPFGCAMHSEGIANGLGTDAQSRCDRLVVLTATCQQSRVPLERYIRLRTRAHLYQTLLQETQWLRAVHQEKHGHAWLYKCQIYASSLRLHDLRL